MDVVTRKKQESVIVARSSGSEQVLKVTVVGIEGDHVSLKFDVGAGLSIHSADEWEHAHAKGVAARLKHNADRSTQRAPYSD